MLPGRHPDASQTPLRRHFQGPGEPQHATETAQDASKTAQDGSQTAQDGAMASAFCTAISKVFCFSQAQDGTKTAPRRLEDGPGRLSDASKTAQDGSQTPLRRPKTPPRRPRTALRRH